MPTQHSLGKQFGDSYEEETLSPHHAAIVEKARNPEVKKHLEKSFKKSQHLDNKVNQLDEKVIQLETASKKSQYLEKENKLLSIQKAALEKSQGFTIFTCSVNTIKADLEGVYDFSPSSWTEINAATKSNKYPKRLEDIIESFTRLEVRVFHTKPLAEDNMRKYFNQMFKILNTDTKLWSERDSMDIDKINAIQHEFRKYLGRTPTTAEKIDFAIVVAQMRHGCNAYHDCYTTRILQENFDAMMKDKKQNPLSLQYLLERLRIIGPWNITEKAVDYVNILRNARANAEDKDSYPITAVSSKDSTGRKIVLLAYPPKLCPYADIRLGESFLVDAPLSTENSNSE